MASGEQDAEAVEPEDDVVARKFVATLKAFTDQIESILELISGIGPEVATLDNPDRYGSDFASALKQISKDDFRRLMELWETHLPELMREVSADQPASTDPIPENETATMRQQRLGMSTLLPAILDEFGTEHWAHIMVNEMLRAVRRPARTQMFLSSLMTMAYSVFETLFERLVRIYYEHSPNAMADAEAAESFTVKQILELGSVEELRAQLLDRRLRTITNEGFAGWISWYEKHYGFAPAQHALDWDLLNEGVARRHLIVHRSGRASREYAERFGGVEPESLLRMTPEYLERFVDELLTLGLRQLVLAWRKITPGNLDPALSWLSQSAYEILKLGRHAAVQALCESALVWDKRQHRILVAQVNLFLARKRLEGLEAVREDIKAWDVTSLGPKFRFAKAALLDDFDTCGELLPLAVSADNVAREELYTWPLLAEFREDERFVRAVASIDGPDESAAGESQAGLAPGRSGDAAVGKTAKKAGAKKAGAKKAAAKKAGAKKAGAKKRSRHSS